MIIVNTVYKNIYVKHVILIFYVRIIKLNIIVYNVEVVNFVIIIIIRPFVNYVKEFEYANMEIKNITASIAEVHHYV